MNNTIPGETQRFTVFQRKSDGYWNATPMCQLAGKVFSGYLRLAATQERIDELSSSMRIHIDDLIVSKAGGSQPEVLRGTWVHPDLAGDVSASMPVYINATSLCRAAG